MTLLRSNALSLTGDLVLEDMYLYSNEINETIIFIGFLFLFCCVSEAKNKADSGLLAKKDKIQNHISQKLVENQLVV